MKEHRGLFGQYIRGMLDEAGIEELHQLLLEAYFTNVNKLNQEEREYTEDLVFELFAKNELNEEHADHIRRLIRDDKKLQKRYYILKNLVNPVKSSDSPSRRLKAESEKTEEQEEEELKLVLEEVLEQAHATEGSPAMDRLTSIISGITNFFNLLIRPFVVLKPQGDDRQLAPVYVLRPQVKVAFAMASLAGLAVIVWFALTPRSGGVLTADNALQDTTGTMENLLPDTGNVKITPTEIRQSDPGNILQEQLAKSDQSSKEGVIRVGEIEMPQLAKQNEAEETSIAGAFDGLLASLYEPPDFNYNLARGEIPDAVEQFVSAADRFNGMKDGQRVERDFDASIAILTGLIERKAFRDQDTIDQLRFYLGSSYLATGMKEGNKEMIERSLDEFSQIQEASSYADDRAWYSALACLKLGRLEESLNYCNILIQNNSREFIDAHSLRDSIVAGTGR